MGKSSRDKRDIYYRLAKEEGWRARSAFKLMHIDEEFGILRGIVQSPGYCILTIQHIHFGVKFFHEPTLLLRYTSH